MNGDLSLSQSLGGLRIANADPGSDDIHSPAQSPSNVEARPNLFHQQTHSSTNTTQSFEPEELNLSSIGFDPSAYSLGPNPPHPQSSQYTAPLPIQQRHHAQPRLVQRTSATFRPQGYDQHIQASPQQSRVSRPVHERPNYSQIGHRPPSTNYDSQAPMATRDLSYSSTIEAPYEASRAAQSSQFVGGVRRSDSRAAAAAAMASRPAQRTPSGRVYTGHPEPVQVTNVAAVGSQKRPSRSTTQDSAYDSTRPTAHMTPSSSYTGELSPLPSSSEKWKEEGAAITVQRTVDKSGKASSRVVKKGVKDFQFGRTLGEGSYSTVLAATDRQTNREYAIKVLDKRHIIKEKKVKYVNIEKDTLNRLTDHPGIVRLYYTFQDERSLYFVLDLASGGELLGVLKKIGSFDEDCSRFYAAQILDAIEYMHIRGIIHRDLKPENVLLDDQMHVKITDFGTAKILEIQGQQKFGAVSVTNDPMDGAESDRAVSFVGTAEYVSPELLTDKNACKASDLWAFGCIVYQLLAGRPPFKAGNEYQTFQKIVNLEYSFPEGFPPVARDLVKKLLVLDPASRLPISGIKSHPFFDGVEWGKGLWRLKAPKLRPYKPYQRTAAAAASAASRNHEPIGGRQSSKSGQPSSSNTEASTSTTRPRMISAVAPPSQLDIDWAPVLTRPNERVLKLGNLIVYSMPSIGAANEAENTSKLSRLFGASATKKRQRLVMISSAARLILAPSGGDKKEAKVVIDLADTESNWKVQQDAKGYTVWCITTRDRHYTFEDPKANTGESGSSKRATQEWVDYIEASIEHASSQQQNSSYADEAQYSGLGSPTSATGGKESDSGLGSEGTGGMSHRGMLRKDASGEGETIGRKRFSKRHSKNGLAAVF